MIDFGNIYNLLISNTNVIIFVILGIVLVFLIIHVIVFFYHWLKYNIGSKILMFNTFIAYIVSLSVLVFIILVSLVSFIF